MILGEGWNGDNFVLFMGNNPTQSRRPSAPSGQWSRINANKNFTKNLRSIKQKLEC